jgi:hypothetical protein
MVKFGGRKFIGFVIVLAVALAVEILRKDGLSANLVTLMLGLYGAFAVGNVSSDFATRPKTNDNDQISKVIESVQLGNQLNMESVNRLRYLTDLADKATGK